jgi:hypothetical protein
VRFTRLGLIGVLTVVIMCGSTASAAAAGTSERAPESRPIARAACPICLPAAAVAIRAGILLATRAAAQAVVRVSVYAAGAFRTAVSRSRLDRAVKYAKKIKDKGKDWVRRNWNGLPKTTRACLKGAGLLSTEQIIDGGFVTEVEFDSFLTFRYPTLDPIDKIQFKSAIDWGEPLETAAAGCVVGWLAFDRSA